MLVNVLCFARRRFFSNTDALYMALAGLSLRTECIVQLHNFRVAGGCSAKTQISLLPVAMPWGTG